ncbi:MAG: hypothetical protein EOL87_07320 [Spartobacteria bacterium]|nr:hypothetical protein [Spartobacteria bacterium]
MATQQELMESAESFAAGVLHVIRELENETVETNSGVTSEKELINIARKGDSITYEDHSLFFNVASKVTL